MKKYLLNISTLKVEGAGAVNNKDGCVVIEKDASVIGSNPTHLLGVDLGNGEYDIVRRPQEDIDAEEAAAKALAEKVEDLDRQMKSQDFFLWQLIVAIIDVGLAKGIWVGTDFPEDLKNKYVEIKAKLEALHPSA